MESKHLKRAPFVQVTSNHDLVSLVRLILENEDEAIFCIIVNASTLLNVSKPENEKITVDVFRMRRGGFEYATSFASATEEVDVLGYLANVLGF